MRRRRAASIAVAAAAFALAPAGGAREHAAGCCYDAHVQGGFNRVTNLAVVGWTVPYRELVSTSVQVGSTIAPTGFLEDGTQVAAPATSGPLSIGTTAFPIDAYVYAQVRFQCLPRDPSAPDCGPMSVPPGATVASLPTELSAPLAGAEQPPDFSLSASSDGSALRVAAGGTSATSTVWVIPEYGFYEPVDFTASAPPGIAVALSPTSSTSGTSATLSASSAVVPGRYAVTVSGSSGGLVRTQPIAVDATAVVPTTTAVTTTAPAPKPKPKIKLTVHRAGRGSGSVRGGGIDCGRRCSTTRPAGTVVKLAATAARASRFVRWSGGCSGTRPRCSLLLDRPLAVTAIFARR